MLTSLALGAGCWDASGSLNSPKREEVNTPIVSGWHDPLVRMPERELKLTFGLYVTPDPDQNPIDPPERFIGYHTALDIEVLPDEDQAEVMVYAVCDGPIIFSSIVDGYGGTLVQACDYLDQPVTVLYGHLDPASLAAKSSTSVSAGDQIAQLGEGNTSETSFNRKHLHLGIHKGSELVLKGYVQSVSELENYLDPKNIFHYE